MRGGVTLRYNMSSLLGTEEEPSTNSAQQALSVVQATLYFEDAVR